MSRKEDECKPLICLSLGSGWMYVLGKGTRSPTQHKQEEDGVHGSPAGFVDVPDPSDAEEQARDVRAG